jgi:5S rRNA maturation endonuclease (ribonuclease M5)
LLGNFTKNISVIDALNQLNIKHENRPNSKGWLNIICPFHRDSSFGNASVNVNSGVISCFKCGASKNISTLLRDHNSVYEFVPTVPIVQRRKEIVKSKNITNKLNYNFIHKEIDPDEFYYLKQRGLTKEFCDEFKIVRSFTDPYCDYFAYPIVDSNKKIFNVEFRKLKQMEYLQTYYASYDMSYSQLSDKFKEQCEKENIRISDYKLYKGNEIIQDKVLFYLLDKKVKYESGSRIKETLFNIDNLDFNKDLYLVEGIGSVGRIWANISKNCTCTFGSKISKEQLEYLKKFKRVILIPDRDLAGFQMVNSLYQELKNLIVIDTIFEDTDTDYVFDLQNTNNYMEANEYIAKYLLKYNVKTLF